MPGVNSTSLHVEQLVQLAPGEVVQFVVADDVDELLARALTQHRLHLGKGLEGGGAVSFASFARCVLHVQEIAQLSHDRNMPKTEGKHASCLDNVPNQEKVLSQVSPIPMSNRPLQDLEGVAIPPPLHSREVKAIVLVDVEVVKINT